MALLDNAEVRKQIKSGAFQNLYYFYGKDTMLVETLTKMLVSKVVKKSDETYNLHKFEGKNFDINLFSDTIEMFPMFADYICIVINDLNGDELGTANIKIFLELLSNVPDTTIVIFNITGFDVKNGTKYITSGNKKIVDFVTKNGITCEIDYKTPIQLEKWIGQTIAKNGCSISRENAQKIAELCLCNTLMISNEIAKLCSFADGNEITPEMLENMVTKQLDSNAFKLAHAVTASKGSIVMDIIDELIFQRVEYINIISAISMAFIDIYRARIALSAGKTEADVKSNFIYKGRDFVVRNAFRDCRNTSVESLRKCIKILKDTDIALKSTSLDGRVLIEKAVTEMLIASKH